MKAKTLLLPNSNFCKTENGKRAFVAASAAVDDILSQTSTSRKGSSYDVYSADVRAKIAKLGEEVGITKAARKLEKEHKLSNQICISTVQSIRDAFKNLAQT